MTDRPIIFSAPMVRALQAGTKTQTRRPMNRQPGDKAVLPVDWSRIETWGNVPMADGSWGDVRCPYGVPGDRLWVRETARCIGWSEQPQRNHGRVDIDYRADALDERCGRSVEYTLDKPLKLFPSHSARVDGAVRWQPAIHMPRWASRITLEVTGVCVERLHDISETDAAAEGVYSVQCNDLGTEVPYYRSLYSARDLYRMLWESINGPGSWDANPWVWCVSFQRVEPA